MLAFNQWQLFLLQVVVPFLPIRLTWLLFHLKFIVASLPTKPIIIIVLRQVPIIFIEQELVLIIFEPISQP